MGSSSSRMGGGGPGCLPLPTSFPHHHRRQRRPSFKRTLSSLLICGAASSSRPRDEMEDDPPEILVESAEGCDLEKIQVLSKSPALSARDGLQCSNPRTGTRVASSRSMLHSEISSMPDDLGNSVAGDKGENLSQNVETFPQLIANDRVIMDFGHSGNRITSRDVPLNFSRPEQSNRSSSDVLEESSDEVPVNNVEREMLLFHDCDSTLVSDSSMDNSLVPYSSGLGFLVSEREHDNRNGNVLQVDVASVSSDSLSVGSSESNYDEARQNSRRLFWDAFSRRSSRRNAEPRTFVFATDDTEGLGSQDRWLLDYSDLFDDGIRSDSRRYGNNSNQITNERRWHSSSEIWERFRDVGRNGSGHRTTVCPSGIHQDGTCACGSTLRAEESGPRASISRIVMLAEALFEVLDEIHRQPISLSLSTLPAPESVVDSLPVKYYRMPECGDSIQQCYICLAEYEEEDQIRVLPCHHEFHLACVDKWLKDIHGVCPLCRGDVHEGSTTKEGSVSTSRTSSFL